MHPFFGGREGFGLEGRGGRGAGDGSRGRGYGDGMGMGRGRRDRGGPDGSLGDPRERFREHMHAVRERFGLSGRGDFGDEGGFRGERGERGDHGGRGGRGGDGGHGHGGRGGRRERLFDSGDFRVLILHLLAQQEPRHGYEIIKAIGQLAGDDYSPSPGAIYPTLTFLEESGSIAIVDPQDTRKRYVLTDEGRKQLAEQDEAVQRMLRRLEMHQMRTRAQRPAELTRATENLRTSLRLRLGQGNVDREVLEKVAEILDRAAVEIQRV